MNWDLILTVLIIVISFSYLIYKIYKFIIGKDNGCNCAVMSKTCNSCNSCDDIYEKLNAQIKN